VSQASFNHDISVLFPGVGTTRDFALGNTMKALGVGRDWRPHRQDSRPRVGLDLRDWVRWPLPTGRARGRTLRNHGSAGEAPGRVQAEPRWMAHALTATDFLIRVINTGMRRRNTTELRFNQEESNNMKAAQTTEGRRHIEPEANRDAITGTPGAHPLGTGVGTVGGAAAGAAIGAVAGPVGAAVGLVAGAVAGGLAGKGMAEAFDPTAEEAYWKANYAKQKYVERDAPYARYQPAYRTGYEGHRRYPGKRYAEVEANLQRDYERTRGTAGLSWDQARNATRDAWDRLETAPSGHANPVSH
jgi:hypothetical protein